MSSIPVGPDQRTNNLKNVPVKLFPEESYRQLGMTSKPVLEELEETVRVVSAKLHSQICSHILSSTVYPTYLTVACEEFDVALLKLSAAFHRHGQIEKSNEKIEQDKADGFHRAKNGN